MKLCSHLESVGCDQVQAGEAGLPQVCCQLTKVLLLGCRRRICRHLSRQLQPLAFLQEAQIRLAKPGIF